MKDISASAAYIRNLDTINAERAKQATLRAIFVNDTATSQVWELLKTPQTVESLSRRLSDNHETDDDLRDEITVSLTKLMREDLIQLSPDS
jgi:hypothetical protein